MNQQIELLKDYKDVLTVHELGQVLNISRNTCYKLLQNGTIKSIRIGTSYRIPKNYILDYIYKF